MNIFVRVIPESEQRTEVSGADWFFDENGDLQVRVSPMSDPRYEALLQLHEVFEAVLCRFNGVTVAQVDAFDQEYYKTHTDDCDAGDDTNAPYRLEHTFATAAERIMAGALKVDWEKYDSELAETYPGPLAVKKSENPS